MAQDRSVVMEDPVVDRENAPLTQPIHPRDTASSEEEEAIAINGERSTERISASDGRP